MKVFYTPDGEDYYRMHDAPKPFILQEENSLKQPIGFINFEKLKGSQDVPKISEK